MDAFYLDTDFDTIDTLLSYLCPFLSPHFIKTNDTIQQMEIRIKTSDYSMTPDVSEYLSDKLAPIEKLMAGEESARCEVEIGRDAHPQHGDVWKAEITLSVKGDRLRAVTHEESINAAIDVAKDEILTQLRNRKDRSVSVVRRVGAQMKEWMRFGGKA